MVHRSVLHPVRVQQPWARLVPVYLMLTILRFIRLTLVDRLLRNTVQLAVILFAVMCGMLEPLVVSSFSVSLAFSCLAMADFSIVHLPLGVFMSIR